MNKSRKDKKIIEVSCDEDGEVYYVVGDVTRLGALRAMLKFMRNDTGLDEEDQPKLEDLEKCNFRQSESEEIEYEDWYWWGKPPEGVKTKPVGMGWIYKLNL